ncbi:MAG: hypothetical protein E6I01_05100 [Chloroflexi bacterium]|nr:MAG: hypothetical protein E6I01_05100 [Chloroflexota bacterium]
MRKLVAFVTFGMLFGLFTALAVPASAQGPCVPVPNGNGSATCTVHLQDATFSMPVTPIACPDGTVVPGGLLTVTVNNGVAHITINKAGDEWDTSTLEGTFVFVAAPTGIAYTGHFTEWFGDSFNNRNQVQHATLNFVGTSATGSKLNLHLELHFSTDANGDLHMFAKAHC